LCGHEHRQIRLAPGDRALCARCGTLMAAEGRFGPDAALAFSITGLILAFPAALLPFVIAGKLGDVRVCRLFTAVGALWDNGMRALAVLVFLCGALLPVALLGAMAALSLPAGLKWRTVEIPFLPRIVHTLEHWAFPEVQVLAVLVALMKLGDLVDVAIGPGFWCYCAMAVCVVLAHRSFDFELRDPAPVHRGTAAAP
jgi:paraquat-inducible protein A